MGLNQTVHHHLKIKPRGNVYTLLLILWSICSPSSFCVILAIRDCSTQKIVNNISMQYPSMVCLTSNFVTYFSLSLWWDHTSKSDFSPFVIFIYTLQFVKKFELWKNIVHIPSWTGSSDVIIPHSKIWGRGKQTDSG